MRQRCLRTREQINQEFEKYIIKNPAEHKGQWAGLFEDPFRPLCIEIGSGKGQFITQKALQNPGINYLACEGAVNINPRILQKAGALELKNLLVITDYIIDPADCFQSGELDGVYLNFSDPWPKERHAHRRLTHISKLLSYKEIMGPGSFLEFKTDNDMLFDFSLEQISMAGLKTVCMTKDLYNSQFICDNTPTEYEEKFVKEGRSIKYLRIEF